METSTDFQQAADASINSRQSGGGLCYARENFQQSRLAGAVASDNANHLTQHYFKTHVFKRPDCLMRVRFSVHQATERSAHTRHHRITQARVLRAWTDAIALAQMLNPNYRLHNISDDVSKIVLNAPEEKSREANDEERHQQRDANRGPIERPSAYRRARTFNNSRYGVKSENPSPPRRRYA